MFHKNGKIKFSLLFFLLMLIGALNVSGQPSQFDVNNNSYPLFNHYLYWYKADTALSPAQAYDHLTATNISLGNKSTLNDGSYNGNDHWLLFELTNTSTQDISLFFLLNCPYLNEVVYFEYKNKQWEIIAKTGTNYAFDTRPYQFNDFVLPINIEKKDNKKILIKANKQGQIFSIKPELLTKFQFHAKEQEQYLTLGFIIGIMFFNIIVNIFLGIGLKDNIHFKYLLYVIGSACWLFTSVGFDFQFIYPNYPAILPYAQPVSGIITLYLMAYLAIDFLRLNEVRNKPYHVLYFTNCLLTISFPLWIFFNIVLPDASMFINILSSINIVSIGIISITTIWAAIVRIKDGFKPAWFYLFALLYLSYSIFVTTSKIIINNDLSGLIKIPNDLQIGLLIESFSIFFGIIYRYNLYKKEKSKLKKQLSAQKLSTARSVLQAQEDERKRLAQDLHDDVGATLSTLLLHISNRPANSKMDEDDVSFYNRSIEITKKAVRDLRNISRDLLPNEFDTSGLFQVLDARITELKSISNIQFNLNLDGQDHLLTESYAINIYRIINELLNNVQQHAKATKVDIDLSITNAEITLIIADNGIGYDPRAIFDGIGLKNLKSRVQYINGQLNIDINNKGTTIIIEVPLIKL